MPKFKWDNWASTPNLAMMNEFELKLVFPDEKFPELEKLVISKGGVRRQRLQAFYFDTDYFTLANSGIALRIRKEGRSWVQTLKAPTSSGFERLEHNVTLNHAGTGVPLLNLQLHADHPAFNAVTKVLQKEKLDPSALRVRYQTDIWRRAALVRARGALLEYALDSGEIRAYQKDGLEKIIGVTELEIELKSGDDCAVINHAKSLVRRYGLCIDTRTKAQRGYLAANGLVGARPVKATELRIKQAHDGALSAALLNSCLSQILPNASEINTGLLYFDEHLHQLRVGLRRLKTAMKSLGLIQIFFTENDLKELETVFAQLGSYRDLNFLDEKLRPALAAVNAPQMNLVSVKDLPHPQQFLKQKSFQLFCLSIIDLSLTLAKIDPSIQRLKPLALKDLDKVQKDTKKLALNFMSIQDEQRHKLRKRLKRLRYSLEFFKDFCDQKRYKDYLKSLGRVSESLGNYNDICVALDKSEQLLTADSNILFAMGWLKAEQTRTRSECNETLQRFYKLKKVW